MAQWIFLVLFFVFVSAGCRSYNPPISDQAKFDLMKPIDCSKANEDITTLEQEKAASSDQLKAGVKMFVPAAAARAILHGDYQERKEVAIGEYNQAIEDKINQIKQKCGAE